MRSTVLRWSRRVSPYPRRFRCVNPRPATVPLYSTVTGERANGAELDAEYWWRNVRQPVRFADAVGRLFETDQNTFLEVSPHPVLSSAIAECAQGRGKPVKALSSLRRKEPERAQMLRSLGMLYSLGYPVDWTLQGSSGRFVKIPTYAWQREHFWHESEDSRDWRLGTRDAHPLLGRSLKTPLPSWMTLLDPNWVAYLHDHKVQGQILIPGAAYLEIATAVGKEAFGTGPYVLEDVKFLKGCFLPKGESREVETVFDPHTSTFQTYTRALETGAPWVFHASGSVRSRQEEPIEPPFSPLEVKNRCRTELSGSACYLGLKKIGLEYGPTFRAIQRLWVCDGEALGELALAEVLWPELERYHFHPAALDACLQVTLGTLAGLGRFEEAGRGVYLPVEIEEARFYGRPGSRLWSHAQLVELNRQGLTALVRAYDENGRLILDIRGLRCQYLGLHGGQAESLDDLLYEFQWQLKPRAILERADVSFNGLPSLRQLARETSAEIESLDLLGKKSRFAALGKAINELCAGYVVAAFRELGATFSPGVRFSEDALAEELGIVATHRRVFPRYLAMLAEDGLLKPAETCASANGEIAPDGAPSKARSWEVASAPSYEPPAKIWLELLSQYPAFFAELTMIARCGQGLAGVLKGTTNPLQLLFPDGSLTSAEHLYSDSPSTRVYNYLTEQIVCSLLEQRPTDRTIRILEIGGGTGGLSSYLLPRLPAGRTDYVFTDLSNHFFIKAGQKFSDFPFVQYKKLDIERDPAEQEFTSHSFDVIVASQVLHATADLRSTIGHVRSLLGSGGVLILLEVVKASRWIDLVFGLTEGWWRFTDGDLRPDYPLLTFDAWERLLAEFGFTDTVDVASEVKVEGFGSAVILRAARRNSIGRQQKAPPRNPARRGAPRRPARKWAPGSQRGERGGSSAGGAPGKRARPLADLRRPSRSRGPACRTAQGTR